MTYPAGIPVLMTALQILSRSAWSGRLPNVTPGESFWADPKQVPNLISAGLARLWQAGDPPAPPPEPPYTAHGSAGFGAGTTNSSPG